MHIQASSISVNGTDEVNYNIDTPLNPNNYYGESKLIADKLIIASGCKHSILRFGGIFGLNGSKHPGINVAITEASKGKVPFIVGSGMAKRNYVWVMDAATAIIKCVQHEITGVQYIGGEIKTIKSMISDICSVFTPNHNPTTIKGREINDQIIDINDNFQITPFRTALEKMN